MGISFECLRAGTDFSFNVVAINGKYFMNKEFVLALSLLCLSPFSSASNSAIEEGFLDPLGGWHILKDGFDPNHPLDVIAFEWDYFMVHDDDFAGIIGYVVANPRRKLEKILQVVPNGANVAFVGERRTSTLSELSCSFPVCRDYDQNSGYQQPIADYDSYGTTTALYSKDERSFFCGDASDQFGEIG